MRQYPTLFYNPSINDETAINTSPEAWQNLVLDALLQIHELEISGRYRLVSTKSFLPKEMTKNDIRLAKMALDEGHYKSEAEWEYTSNVIPITDVWASLDKALTQAKIGFIRSYAKGKAPMTMDYLIYIYLGYLVEQGILINLNTKFKDIHESSYKLDTKLLTYVQVNEPQTSCLPVQLVHPEARVPTRNNPTDAGLDLYATEPLTVPAKGFATVDFGIKLAIPSYFGGFIYARSGLGTKEGITPRNCVGVIDSSYRGNLKAVLYNDTDVDYQIETHDRVAQLVIAPVALVTPKVVDVLSVTTRGANGFGNSGK